MSSQSPIYQEADSGNPGDPKAPLVAAASDTDGNKVDEEEKRLRAKVDIRLCTIAGLLCSLNLLDSGIISSASVTSMLSDLGLDKGNRYSVSILIFTVASVCFQLPATIVVRLVGPRIFFSLITVSFGLITLVGTFHGFAVHLIIRSEPQEHTTLLVPFTGLTLRDLCGGYV